MDFSLTQEQVELVNMVKAFARDEIAPAQIDMDSDHAFPNATWKKWSDLGMAGIMLPEVYGGSELDALTYILCIEEVAVVSQTFALIWQIHVAVSNMYLTLGTDAQKQTWLPLFARGEKTPSFALTEVNAGSDAAGIRTSAVRDDDGNWVLNGTKVFISNAGHDLSDGTVVMAITGERPDGKKEISCFIVPRGTPGYELGQAFDKMAWHGLDNRELVFTDVKLTDADMLGPKGKGLGQALGTLNLGRIVIGTLGGALTRACLEESLSYATERTQFGQPLSAFQLTQAKIANMAAHAEAVRRFSHHAAWRFDNGEDCHAEAAMVKLLGSKLAVQAATDAYQIHGGYGFMREYKVNRLYREAQILEIGEGTSEIQQLIIARSLGC